MKFHFLVLSLAVLILSGCKKDFCPKPGDKDKWGNLVYAVHCDKKAKKFYFKTIREDGSLLKIREFQNVNNQLLKVRDTNFMAVVPKTFIVHRKKKSSAFAESFEKDKIELIVPDIKDKFKYYLEKDLSFYFEPNTSCEFYLIYERVYNKVTEKNQMVIYIDGKKCLLGDYKDQKDLKDVLIDSGFNLVEAKSLVKKEITRAIKIFESYDKRVITGFYSHDASDYEKAKNFDIDYKIPYDPKIKQVLFDKK